MSDLIDRQALLKQIDIDSDGEPGYYGDTWKFIDTIKNMPNVHDLPKDTDTISRQAAIKILHEALDAADQIADVPFGVYQNYRDKMNELPPARPQRIKGHWVDDCTYMGIQCSVCGKSLQDYIHATEYAELMEVPNFCPNCGAEMRGEQDG